MTPYHNYNYHRRFVGIGILFGLVLVLATALFIKCGENPVGFTPDIPERQDETQSTQGTSTSGGTTSGVQVDDTQGPLEECGLQVRPSQASGSINPDTLVATVNVPAEYNGPGNVWIYLWDSEVNDGIEYGPGPAGEDFSFQLPECRDYNFRIAGEVDLDGDKRADNQCQDDRFRLRLTCVPTPPPPPPPVCQEPNVNIDGRCLPICDDGPRQVNLQGILAEDACHPFCTVNPNHPFCSPPECEYGEPFWNGEGWSCPTCQSQNPPTYNISGPEREYYTPAGEECENVPVRWVYKVTGNQPSTRKFTCEDPFNIYSGPQGVYSEDTVIPGQGVVDACVFTSYPGSDDFHRNAIGADPRFRLVTVETEEECEEVEASGIKTWASVTFFNKGGTVRLYCNNILKDTESIEVACGSQGTIPRQFTNGSNNGGIYYEHPTAHTNSQCTVQVTQ